MSSKLELNEPRPCSSCGKPETIFYSRGRKCRDCVKQVVIAWREKNKKRYAAINKRARLKHKYNLTENQFNAQLEKQNHRCAICDKKKRLVVDHCHISGNVRGLLCHSCNTHLGVVENSLKMEKIRTYLMTNMSSTLTTQDILGITSEI